MEEQQKQESSVDKELISKLEQELVHLQDKLHHAYSLATGQSPSKSQTIQWQQEYDSFKKDVYDAKQKELEEAIYYKSGKNPKDALDEIYGRFGNNLQSDLIRNLISPDYKPTFPKPTWQGGVGPD